MAAGASTLSPWARTCSASSCGRSERGSRLRTSACPIAADGGVPGLRREELASLAEVSPDYYRRIEQGHQLPSDEVAEALARALRLDGIAAAYLFDLARSQPGSRQCRRSPVRLLHRRQRPRHRAEPVVRARAQHAEAHVPGRGGQARDLRQLGRVRRGRRRFPPCQGRRAPPKSGGRLVHPRARGGEPALR